MINGFITEMKDKNGDSWYHQIVLEMKDDEIERLKTNLEVANEDLTRIAQLLNLEEGCTIYDIEDKIERLNNIINELDKQNGELGADLSIIKDRVIKTNWWLENMLKQATNRETKAIINGALDLLLGSDKE